jgi:nucleoside-triphosphatase THEP1
MIYPSRFPEHIDNKAEQLVFEKLERLAHKYDIFYSRKFLSSGYGEKNEYEIDFIICVPNKAIVCLEVKGGIITYDGITGNWLQNSKPMIPGPDSQATSAAHSLVSRYKKMAYDIPISWALCFPDCEIPYGATLPTSLTEKRVIGRNSLLFLDIALTALFKSLEEEFPERGGNSREYEAFKVDILRGIGFVQKLGTRVKYDEEKFIQLAEQQLDFFKRFEDNKRIVVDGPAGSGKTIVAKTLAQDVSAEGGSVLLICYNRTLMNRLAYSDGIRHQNNITVCTFHSFAKRNIEQYEADWLKSVNTKSSETWDMDIPIKLDALISEKAFEKYDCIIIDEGQDFKEFWFECLFKLVKPDGKIVVFLDKMQDIFKRQSELPNNPPFAKVSLTENCRNTKRIVKYLEKVVNASIKTWNTPEGDEVVLHLCKNEVELQSKLVQDVKNLTSAHDIRSDQMLIIINSDKASSSLASMKKIGNMDLKSLDNKARFERNSIHYTTISTFKGLEADVVFLLDTHKIDKDEKVKKLYTQASRAKHKLFVYDVVE